MKKANKKSRTGGKDVDAYIAAAPEKAQPMLRQLRRGITSAAPNAEEEISYGIPYYGYYGRLIYFAAFKNHVSVYIMGAGRKKYAKDLAPYQQTKATLHFPIGTHIPLALIRKIVKAQMKENEARRK